MHWKSSIIMLPTLSSLTSSEVVIMSNWPMALEVLLWHIVKLLRLIDTIWHHKTESTFAQVMAFCLAAGTKPLPEPKLTFYHGCFLPFTQEQFMFRDYTFKIATTFSRGQWVNSIKVKLIRYTRSTLGFHPKVTPLNCYWITVHSNRYKLDWHWDNCMIIVTLRCHDMESVSP